jgi:hypothetical protein
MKPNKSTTTEQELAVLVAASRAEQGLGPFVEDPTAIAKVACLAADALRTRGARAVTADATGS